MKINPVIWSVVLILGVLSSGTAMAQVCEPSRVQSDLQYLRRLSVDLRGHLPTLAEMESVVANGELDPEIVGAMLDSDGFLNRMRAYHKDLRWTNVESQRLTGVGWTLNAPSEGQSPAYWSAQRALRYRGAAVACLDEPARFGQDGRILTTPHPTIEGAVQDGYVEVEPYWAPGTTVKACAFEAQEALEGPSARNPDIMADCSSTTGSLGCGCGPNLRWCQLNANGISTRFSILDSFAEQLMRFSDAVVRGERPYTDFILATDMEVNGPVAHYVAHQARTGGAIFLSTPEQNYEVPDGLGFDEDRWVTVERGPRHAGVLTMPAYLIKFQTNRSRANRFYNAFLCQFFEAPPGGLPPGDDACNDEPNLTERCGCKFCHVAVEPAAAHWGRYSEAGLGALNEGLFPTEQPNCATERGAQQAICQLFYVTEATHPDEEPYLGFLKPYLFADESMIDAIEQGPAVLAQEAIDSGQFGRCTVRKMWRLFMGQDAGVDDEEVIEELFAEFEANDYNLKALILALVTRPEYVQGQRFAGGE